MARKDADFVFNAALNAKDIQTGVKAGMDSIDLLVRKAKWANSAMAELVSSKSPYIQELRRAASPVASAVTAGKTPSPDELKRLATKFFNLESRLADVKTTAKGSLGYQIGAEMGAFGRYFSSLIPESEVEAAETKRVSKAEAAEERAKARAEKRRSSVLMQQHIQDQKADISLKKKNSAQSTKVASDLRKREAERVVGNEKIIGKWESDQEKKIATAKEKAREARQKRISNRRVQRAANLEQKAKHRFNLARFDDQVMAAEARQQAEAGRPDLLMQSGVGEEFIQPEVFQAAKSTLQKETTQLLAQRQQHLNKATKAQAAGQLEVAASNRQAAAAIEQNIQALQKQALSMEKGRQAAEKYVKTYGFGVQQRTYGAAKGFTALASASQGAVLGLSALDGNILNMAFSLIFLQFSMAPVAAGMAALTAAAVLWGKKLSESIAHAEKVRKLSLQMRNLNIDARATAKGGKLVTEAVNDFGFSSEDASKALGMLIQNVDNFGAAFAVVRDIAADTTGNMEGVTQAFLDTIKVDQIAVGSLEEFRESLDRLIPPVVRVGTPLENLVDTAENWYNEIVQSIDPTQRAATLIRLLRENWESINVQNRAILNEQGAIDHIFGGTDFEKAERFQNSMATTLDILQQFHSAPDIASKIIDFARLAKSQFGAGFSKDVNDFMAKIVNTPYIGHLVQKGLAGLKKMAGFSQDMRGVRTAPYGFAEEFVKGLFPPGITVPPEVHRNLVKALANVADDAEDLIPGFELGEIISTADRDLLTQKILQQMALISDDIKARPDGHVEFLLEGQPFVHYKGENLSPEEFSTKVFPVS